MLKKLLTVLAVAVVVVSSLGIAASAWAITTYSYTGNNFTMIVDNYNGVPISGTYTTQMHVSGWFEVADPIAGNQFKLAITPLSYSFFDGRNTYTEHDSVVDPLTAPFQFSTDATGNIIGWYIGLSRSGTGNVITWWNMQLPEAGGQSLDYDYGAVQPDVGFSYKDSAKLDGLPGVWTSTTPTPIPGALVLFGSGLLGLVGIGRKRFMK